MRALQAYLFAAFVVLAFVTARAIAALGLDGGQVFLTDFAHPWRAQFNTDFVLYAIPVAAWIVWRERSLAVGALCALGSLAGGVFTLPYLLVATVRARGSILHFLLGHHGARK